MVSDCNDLGFLLTSLDKGWNLEEMPIWLEGRQVPSCFFSHKKFSEILRHKAE